jgi:hypothetical protein
MTLTAGVLTGVFLFLLAIPASLIGWHKNIHYLTVWHDRIVANERVGPNANFNIHSFRNQSLANAVYLWTKATRRTSAQDSQSSSPRDRPERIVHPVVRLVMGVILTLLLAVGLVLGRRENGLDQAAAFSLACCATLLISPLSWGHYFMAEVPAFICVPIWLSRRGQPIPARLVAVFPAVLSWSHYLAMPYTGALGLLGLGTTAWFLVACGLILWVEISTPLDISPLPFGRWRKPGVVMLSRPHSLKRASRRARAHATSDQRPEVFR